MLTFESLNQPKWPVTSEETKWLTFLKYKHYKRQFKWSPVVYHEQQQQQQQYQLLQQQQLKLQQQYNATKWASDKLKIYENGKVVSWISYFPTSEKVALAAKISIWSKNANNESYSPFVEEQLLLIPKLRIAHGKRGKRLWKSP